MTTWWFLVALCLLVCARSSFAAPSQQCVDETTALESYQASEGSPILSEQMWEALHKDVRGRVKKQDGCNYTSSFEFACDIVYEGDNNTLIPFEDTCHKANGQIAHRTLDIKSNFLGAWTFNITMEGIPQCVGLSCNPKTLQRGELKSPVFDVFVQNMEVGDICEEKGDSWGQLDFWSDFAFSVASLGGMDLSDCFLGEGEEDEESDDSSDDKGPRGKAGGMKKSNTEKDERRLRGVRGAHKKTNNAALIDVFAGHEDTY